MFNLTIGNQVSITFDWTPRNTGEYLLEFKINPQDFPIEVTKDNNYKSIDLDFKSDISISQTIIFSNSNPIDGETITITITLENVGNIDITDSFIVEIFDGLPDSGSAKIIKQYFVEDELPIGAGEEIFISVKWKTDGGGREHTIYIEVNPDHDFLEEDYDNNVAQQNINVRKKAAEDTDYSMLIVVFFVIVFGLIIFLILSPSKQATGKGKANSKDITEALGRWVEKKRNPRKKTVLCTDQYTAYDAFARKKNLMHKKIPGWDRKWTTKKIYHLQHVNNVHSKLKKWIRQFNGVSSKYLPNYLIYFKIQEIIKEYKDQERMLIKYSLKNNNSYLPVNKFKQHFNKQYYCT